MGLLLYLLLLMCFLVIDFYLTNLFLSTGVSVDVIDNWSYQISYDDFTIIVALKRGGWVTNQFIGGTQSKKTNFEKIKRVLMSCPQMGFSLCYGLPSILTYISEGGNVDITKRFMIDSFVALMINKYLLKL